jgi:hypothetical protein
MVESRPEALPHAQRTVGQLVAEAIRFYGDHFWQVIVLGLVFVAIDIASWSERPVQVQILTLYAFAPLLTAAYVRASMLVTGGAWSWPALGAGIAVFLPFPALLLIYAFPGVVWLALFGLAVPAAVAERLGVVAALRRGWRLGRADAVHAIGGLATFVILYFICRYALDVLLASQGDQTEAIAVLLADLVLSPLLFVGPALLYLDQAARVE